MKIKQIIRIIIFIISLILVGDGYHVAISLLINMRHDALVSNPLFDAILSIMGIPFAIIHIFVGEILYSLFVFKFGEKSVKFAVSFFIVQLIGGLILLLHNLNFMLSYLYGKYPHLFKKPKDFDVTLTLVQYVDVGVGAVLTISAIAFFIIIGIKLFFYRK